jgi:AcrR family transcriptional regulator
MNRGLRMKKQPQHTAKTKQNLINAFWELAQLQGMGKVTITAITKNAGLNRSTFYEYFTDMADLIHQAENDIMDDLRERMTRILDKYKSNDVSFVLQHIVDVFALYEDKLLLLISKNGDPNFMNAMKAKTTTFFREYFKTTENNMLSEFVTVYVISALTGLFTYWHESGRKISILEFAQIVHSLIAKGMYHALHLNEEPA